MAGFRKEVLVLILGMALVAFFVTLIFTATQLGGNIGFGDNGGSAALTTGTISPIGTGEHNLSLLFWLIGLELILILVLAYSLTRNNYSQNQKLE